jgi:hypothetical protein
MVNATAKLRVPRENAFMDTAVASKYWGYFGQRVRLLPECIAESCNECGQIWNPTAPCKSNEKNYVEYVF